MAPETNHDYQYEVVRDGLNEDWVQVRFPARAALHSERE